MTPQLRITQDWNEATENWKRRGKWMFLELFEEFERATYVAVSIKQIWYDVRARSNFDYIIRDWTCNERDLWRQPIMEIVSHYYTLTVGEILSALKLPSDFSEGTAAPDANRDANRGNNIVGSDTGTSDLPRENGESSNLMDTDQNCGCTIIIPVEEKDGTNALVDEAIEKVKDTMLHDEPVLPESRQRQRQVLSCYEAASDHCI